ncbi:MAG: MFS transporter, partial [Bacteroidota bacterium]
CSFFVLVSARWVPAMTMITSAVRPENRGGFLSLNASVRYMSSALASLIAGWAVMEQASGELAGFDRTGYIAVAATLLTLFIAGKLVIADQPTTET